jgi:hypothetical protein
VNLIHAFSKRYELQKSRADDGDFCDMFCTNSPRLSSIEAVVVVQPIDNYMQKFLITVHRSIQPLEPEREIMGVARSLIYRVVGLDSHKGLAARSRFAFAS